MVSLNIYTRCDASPHPLHCNAAWWQQQGFLLAVGAAAAGAVLALHEHDVLGCTIAYAVTLWGNSRTAAAHVLEMANGCWHVAVQNCMLLCTYVQVGVDHGDIRAHDMHWDIRGDLYQHTFLLVAQGRTVLGRVCGHAQRSVL